MGPLFDGYHFYKLGVNPLRPASPLLLQFYTDETCGFQWGVRPGWCQLPVFQNHQAPMNHEVGLKITRLFKIIKHRVLFVECVGGTQVTVPWFFPQRWWPESCLKNNNNRSWDSPWISCPQKLGLSVKHQTLWDAIKSQLPWCKTSIIQWRTVYKQPYNCNSVHKFYNQCAFKNI